MNEILPIPHKQSGKRGAQPRVLFTATERARSGPATPSAKKKGENLTRKMACTDFLQKREILSVPVIEGRVACWGMFSYPVSYTHLDVYKRQLGLCVPGIILFFPHSLHSLRILMWPRFWPVCIINFLAKKSQTLDVCPFAPLPADTWGMQIPAKFRCAPENRLAWLAPGAGDFLLR